MLERIYEISVKLDFGKFTCFDFIKCVFNLNETDIRVIQSIPENKGKTIIEISKLLKKDRSTIHRSLEKLVACNLCYKERKTGKNRGFADYYHVIPENEVLKKAEQNLDDCYTKIKKMINDVEKITKKV
jgi:predicted transcriptional regulator